MAIECWPGKHPRGVTAKRALGHELRELGAAHPHTDLVRLFYFVDRFPVDVRHNAKIHRLRLARDLAGQPGWNSTNGSDGPACMPDVVECSPHGEPCWRPYPHPGLRTVAYSTAEIVCSTVRALCGRATRSPILRPMSERPRGRRA